MWDWLERSKEKYKEYENSRCEHQPSILGLRRGAEEEPPQLPTPRSGRLSTAVLSGWQRSHCSVLLMTLILYQFVENEIFPQ